MGVALALAERGRATVRPNPLVGCVLVHDGAIVGEGWHERPGGPHAEITAIAAAGERRRGATAYVTLEPCDHTGRTGPCTQALIDAEVRRVVYAADDPVNGGAATLRDAGVEVIGGVRVDDARRQNEVFFHVQATGRPFVVCKLAQSLDGRVAARDGSSRWITSEQARIATHQLRALAEAVAVGSGTVLADDPSLDVRHVEAPAGQPRPVVFDARGRTPSWANVARPGAVILTTQASTTTWRGQLTDAGADVVVVPTTDAADGAPAGVALDAALRALTERRVQSLLVEGGATLAGALQRAELIDRLEVFVAPCTIGGDGLAAFAPPGAASVEDRWLWRIDEVRQLGADLWLTARPQRTDGAATTASARDGLQRTGR
ncbi:MAG: bifunctional diaminohydroxyphosphoribosylaminopyrimidine deaminase/5-amino-6-(5-phosphoribosylamino)uracil reductase RibD [Actinomycetota bacterium]|nr:bifunctional diaminohydroxyphosphoribosylaminopyrimidine deaminase/5-amino-6-(5-phosphoribosylamino)uracil reductase RibD [Actinomycetota bacterium]